MKVSNTQNGSRWSTGRPLAQLMYQTHAIRWDIGVDVNVLIINTESQINDISHRTKVNKYVFKIQSLQLFMQHPVSTVFK